MAFLGIAALLCVLCSHGTFGANINRVKHYSGNFSRAGVVNYIQKTRGEPWPLPQVFRPTANQLILDTYFGFKTDETCTLLADALSRYIYDIGPLDSTTCQSASKEGDLSGLQILNRLNVKLSTPCVDTEYPTETMCENYTLTISASTGVADLTACSFWGALRGLETFRQLLVSAREQPLCVLVNETVINDYPRFAHRGLMIDTSRHYLDLVSIHQSIDALVQNRMNVLHWHIVDDQSFPYVSVTFPGLAIQGAFTSRHTYTVNDIRGVIEYARVRGVRVIPEFDTPGHTQSWGIAYPQLLVPCYTGSQPNGNVGPMDPSKDYTFDFVKQLFAEVAGLFPDKYFHMGGDEVDFNCWASNPNITAFMAKMGFGKDYRALENYYIEKILPYVTADKKTGVLWQEIFDDGVNLPKDQVIVHVWKSNWESELNNVTKKGYRTLISSPFYFNYIAYGSDWIAAYNTEPLSFGGTAEQQALVIGGEACMWGEYVDSSNVLSRTWPRASAFAERFWSGKGTRDVDYATRRLEEQRCRMIKRGLMVEPVSGPGYCDDEPRAPFLQKPAANRNRHNRVPVGGANIL